MSDTYHSLWLSDAAKPAYPQVSKDIVCDVAVIGGGIAGVTTAYLLSNLGKQVILLEKGTIGSGATGYTTAMITQYIDVAISELVDLFGKSAARKIWKSGGVAIDTIEKIIHEAHIDCDFMRSPYYVYAQDEEEYEELEEEQTKGKEIDISLALSKTSSLPFANKGVLTLKNQAKFHPIKYLDGVAKAASKKGLQIFEKTEVLDVNEKQKTIRTKEHTISAQSIVVATHVPINNPKKLTMKKGTYTTYMIVLEIPPKTIDEALYQDQEVPYHYFRVEKGKIHDRIILGGEDHRSQIPVSQKKSFQALEDYFKNLFPHISYKVIAKWSGPIIETADGLPYIGPMKKNQNIYYATGFSGNGMTYGTLAGMIISDAILQKPNPYSQLYRASRIPTPHQVWNKIGDYTKEFFGGAVKNAI